MTVNVTGAKIYYTIPWLGGLNITQTTVSILVVSLILCLGSYFLGKNLKKRPGALQVLTETAVNSLYNLVGDVMGKHNLHWAPFIGTIFMSSLVGSLISLTGFLRSTTADLAVPLTWAVMVSVLIWYSSIKANGFLGWLKGFTEPIVVMTPMNIISEIAQPVSMAFRHFGNVVGGSVITSILYTALAMASSALLNLICAGGVIPSLVLLVIGALLFWKKQKAGKIFGIILLVLGGLGVLQVFDILSGVPILQLGIPAVISLYFDLFSGFIQAFVFCLLTMVYISNACPAPDEAAA